MDNVELGERIGLFWMVSDTPLVDIIIRRNG